jgi:hypothetical protein
MHKPTSWIVERSTPIAVTVLLVAGGLLYTIWWTLAAHHAWQSVSDLWNSAGISLGVAHAHWGVVYGQGSQLDSPPGFEFLLAPFMTVGHAVGLQTAAEAHGHYPVFWLFLVSFCTVLASSVLFALDAVARWWDLSEGRRLALSVVAGLGVVSATVFWGHPEDCLALALVIWAALAVERQRDSAEGLVRASWLLGLAVACQPLALLAVAPVVARFGWRSVARAGWRVALPSVVVVLPELVTHAGNTLHRIVDQPFLPADESTTPFTHMARSLGHGMYGGGPLRLVAVVAAVALGWAVCRRRFDLPTVFVVMAAAFTLRVVFESELLGFYFYPVVALALLLTVRARSWSWFSVCAALSVVSLVLGNRRAHDVVAWWPGMILTTVVVLGLAYWCTTAAELAPEVVVAGVVVPDRDADRLLVGQPS